MATWLLLGTISPRSSYWCQLPSIATNLNLFKIQKIHNGNNNPVKIYLRNRYLDNSISSRLTLYVNLEVQVFFLEALPTEIVPTKKLEITNDKFYTLDRSYNIKIFVYSEPVINFPATITNQLNALNVSITEINNEIAEVKKIIKIKN